MERKKWRDRRTVYIVVISRPRSRSHGTVLFGSTSVLSFTRNRSQFAVAFTRGRTRVGVSWPQSGTTFLLSPKCDTLPSVRQFSCESAANLPQNGAVPVWTGPKYLYHDLFWLFSFVLLTNNLLRPIYTARLSCATCSIRQVVSSKTSCSVLKLVVGHSKTCFSARATSFRIYVLSYTTNRTRQSCRVNRPLS